MTTATKPQSLAAKLSEVMALMGHIKKEGFNKNQKYRFVRETDVAERASELLSERKIWVHQGVVESGIQPLYTAASGMEMFLSSVLMEFWFVDGETGEKTDPVRFPGQGVDSGDKGIYKAMTGAEKYFLMKTFLISTGDDPEADEKVDREAAGAVAGKGSRVKGGASTTAQRGGKTTAITPAQVKEITRLAKEKGLSKGGFIAVLSMVVEQPIGDDDDLNAILRSLRSEEGAKVIGHLNEVDTVVAAAPAATEDDEGDPDDDQESMSIV